MGYRHGDPVAYDSEITGAGGPSQNLKAYLNAKGIPVYYNDVLQPAGPFVIP